MTKRDWDKADRYVEDPGAVRDVPDLARPITGPISEADRQRRRTARAEAEAERVARFRLLQEAVRLEATVRKIEERRQAGQPPTFFDQAALKRWEEIRGVFAAPAG